MLYLILHSQGGAVSVLLVLASPCPSVVLLSSCPPGFGSFVAGGVGSVLRHSTCSPFLPLSPPSSFVLGACCCGLPGLKLCVKAQHFLPCCLICFFPPHCVKAQRHRLVALLACLFLPHCVKAQRLFTAWIYPWHCPLSPSVLSPCGALLP